MDLRESVELALKRRLPGLQTSWGGEGGGAWLETPPACIPEVGAALRDDPATAFDFLACMSGVDRHPLDPRFEVVYHLRSLGLNRLLVVKTRVSEKAASVPTLTGVWRTADWFEREIYDLLGVTFSGHPDLRRILLPEDWDGYPLRKDYPLEGLHPGPGLAAEEG